jgi:hypothetical protein
MTWVVSRVEPFSLEGAEDARSTVVHDNLYRTEEVSPGGLVDDLL